jgi:outer membrane protein assembly factor BamB
MVLPSGVNPGSPQTSTTHHTFEYDIMNSPAVTDDYIIVATGQKAPGGHINHIYALPRDNISKSPVWDFTNNNVPICYYASPVVAGDRIFITSWGGDNGTYVIEGNRYVNNKLLAVDIKNENRTWQQELPAPSYSTPAVSLAQNIVVAGCNSNNESLFAFSLEGTPLWSKKIGAIGYASPVISNDVVFATATIGSLKTIVTALNLTTGEILWNTTVCSTIIPFSNIGDSTPTVFNSILYVAAPDGTFFALHTSNGTEVWSNSKVYIRSHAFSPSSVTSSPVYADGKVYIGTPSTNAQTYPEIVALNAASGTIVWSMGTFWKAGGENKENCPVLSSPIVSNGLLFVADEDGNLYSVGSYKAPTQAVNGSVTSYPIKLPEAFWWYRFYYFTSYNQSVSDVTFKLLDEDGTVLRDLQNGTTLPMSTMTLPRTLRLRADFTSDNISADNPRLLRWVISFTEDATAPWLNPRTITPPFVGWWNTVVPQISITVKDNLTGLMVNSAQYTLQYVLDNITRTNTYAAQCTGVNGTTLPQNMTANLTKIPDFHNITALRSITFHITDLAGNTATLLIPIKQDLIPPTSQVITTTLKAQYNATAKFIWVNGTASDSGTDASGVKIVRLFYRYSSTGNFSGNWILFAESTSSKPSWKFNFTTTPNQPGGYFEVCTNATDYAGNSETTPTHGDASFQYDWKKPNLPSFSGDTLWFRELPEFTVSFSDDFRLDTIQYRPNFDTLWTTIATHVNRSTYNSPWSLLRKYWDQMEEGDVYYLYFRINDTLGNVRVVTDDTDAIIIRKDISIPTANIEIPALENQSVLGGNFTVSAMVSDQGSGVKTVKLYYRFSADKSNWSDWEEFGTTLTTSPYDWKFTSPQGDGYYEFKINVTDDAGNSQDSSPLLVPVISFPLDLSLILVGLVVVLLLLGAVIYLKWRKRT